MEERNKLYQWSVQLLIHSISLCVIMMTITCNKQEKYLKYFAGLLLRFGELDIQHRTQHSTEHFSLKYLSYCFHHENESQSLISHYRIINKSPDRLYTS